jgi:CMP-N,N'-diacetyllegionaminic acid synthase
VAKDTPVICKILVSTDDTAIAAFCSKAGTLLPWLHPAELVTDSASSVDLVLHALDWYGNEKGVGDGVLLLQPTSAFRTKKTVLRGIELFSKNGQQPVLGVSHSLAHPMWMFKMKGEYLVPFMQEYWMGTRAQDWTVATLSLALTTDQQWTTSE